MKDYSTSVETQRQVDARSNFGSAGPRSGLRLRNNLNIGCYAQSMACWQVASAVVISET